MVEEGDVVERRPSPAVVRSHAKWKPIHPRRKTAPKCPSIKGCGGRQSRPLTEVNYGSWKNGFELVWSWLGARASHVHIPFECHRPPKSRIVFRSSEERGFAEQFPRCGALVALYPCAGRSSARFRTRNRSDPRSVVSQFILGRRTFFLGRAQDAVSASLAAE